METKPRTVLAETADLIYTTLMVRAGSVIDESVSRERANNAATAIAHLIAGSGYNKENT